VSRHICPGCGRVSWMGDGPCLECQEKALRKNTTRPDAIKAAERREADQAEISDKLRDPEGDEAMPWHDTWDRDDDK
jgi:hypothetical protein